jgi:inosine/xanthosine triphosphatase
MKKVIVGSQNPAKIKSVSEAFKKVFINDEFDFVGINSPSKVSDQPMSDEETYQGASNRALYTKSTMPNADYWIGIEGGIAYHHGDMEAYAWIVILSKHQSGKARTGSFVLPREVQTLIEDGVELGEADDLVFKRQNSKQKNGAVGILTNDLITRTSYYEHAAILALIPFIKTEFYSN